MISSSANRIARLAKTQKLNLSNLVARPKFKAHYDNFIDGKFVPPAAGKYFDNVSPIDGKTYVTERSNLLLRIADVIEKNLDHLATVETVDNGKPIRETRAADLPLVIDHFRYFAGVIRGEEGTI
eukprot:gene23090-28220_t